MEALNQPSKGSIASDEFLIPSDTAGISLHLRRKRPAHVERFSAETTVLLMHGATFSSVSLFDTPVDDASFMDQLALNGFDVYAVDVRGYGGSTLPAEMTGPFHPGAHPVGIETAIRDISAAVGHILGERRLDQLNLVAMSWGGSVARRCAGERARRFNSCSLVHRLGGNDSGQRTAGSRSKYRSRSIGRSAGYS